MEYNCRVKLSSQERVRGSPNWSTLKSQNSDPLGKYILQRTPAAALSLDLSLDVPCTKELLFFSCYLTAGSIIGRREKKNPLNK